PAVGREGDDRAEMAARAPGQLPPEHAEVLDPRGPVRLDQPAATEGEAAAALARLGIAEIDEAAVREIGGERDVEHAALAVSGDLRHAGDVDHLAARPPDLELAALFGDERAPVRHEGDRPGLLEIAHLRHRERPRTLLRDRLVAAGAAAAEQDEEKGEGEARAMQHGRAPSFDVKGRLTSPKMRASQ